MYNTKKITMGVKEEFEWLQEVVMDALCEVSGKHGGVDVDTVVYNRVAPHLWRQVCKYLNINAPYVFGLITVEDYVHEFSKIVTKRNADRQAFLEKLTEFVFLKTGKRYLPDEQILKELENEGFSPEEGWIYRNLKLLRLRNDIRKEYSFYRKITDFCYAQTINDMVNIMFGKKIAWN